MSKNHRAGGKIGGRHTTVIDASQPVIDYLQKHHLVTNIIVGRIKMGIGAAPQRIKLRLDTGCLIITVRGSASVQEIRIFSSDVNRVKVDMEHNFAHLCKKKGLINK